MDIKLRKWLHSDANELAMLCNNIDRRFLSDRLPNPYTIDDAGFWLQNVINSEGKQGVFRAITSAEKSLVQFPLNRKTMYIVSIQISDIFCSQISGLRG